MIMASSKYENNPKDIASCLVRFQDDTGLLQKDRITGVTL